ncbi:hypothetical protein HMPREF9440_01622 [Sutterella parvirubra YIT 11816]|uniref:Uncharacterized protein n=1 Tax=Sutterella parvirubra YIT 11816 TaxID=762967 RepID=H3KFV3_9BURK|nr:hypothetical protein HMPREF9440_01622 [Sutterella parvirubra YIT 11816]
MRGVRASRPSNRICGPGSSGRWGRRLPRRESFGKTETEAYDPASRLDAPLRAYVGL